MTFHLWEWTKSKSEADKRRALLDTNSSDDVVLAVVPIDKAGLDSQALVGAEKQDMKFAVGQQISD